VTSPKTGAVEELEERVLGTVCRAGDLLDLFDGDHPEWGATAVSSKLDITKSQAHELLVSLEAIGLLRRAPRGRFRLGWKMVAMGERLLRTELTGEAGPLLRRLGMHTGTSVDLVAFDGESCVRIGGYGPSMHSTGRARETGHVSATGKILLAGMSDERVARALPGMELGHELDTVRTRQVAFEAAPGRRAVAAPMLDRTGAVMAAVGVAVTPDVWTKRHVELTRAVCGTAKRLTQSLRADARRDVLDARTGVVAAAPAVEHAA
jgi:IclR family KDG regulon transcriptional repressor